MNKILIAIFLSIILILSGCATYDGVDEWNNTKPFNNSKNTNWHIRAAFLLSNYPDCTYNRKALILANDMKEAKESFQVIRKYYKSEVIYIFSDGIRIWPPYRSKDIMEEYKKLEIIDEKMEVYSKNADMYIDDRNIYIKEFIK